MEKKKGFWDKLQEQIDRGKQGLNHGIPMQGFDTLSKYICNIQQGRYDAIFAGTGIGKTAFVDDAYVFGAINYVESHPECPHDLEIIYYSLEITPEKKMAKYIAKRIWEDYGILTTINEILSIGDNKIRPEVSTLIDSYKEELERIQQKYIRFRTSLNPDYLYKDLMTYYEKRGVFVYNAEKTIILDYIPNNPSLITLVVIDHLGLISLGKYSDLKAAIDKASKNLVFFRNMCMTSPVVILQINRASEQMNRKEGDYWHPVLSDVKNTSNVSEDCSTAIGLASPFYLQIEKCMGYDITKYKDRYRFLKICKNRDGQSNISASMLFIGEYGGYYQLPPVSELQGSPPKELKRINDYYKNLKQS